MSARASFNKPRAMIVAGVMSGTSADGMDVALVRISPARGQDQSPRLKLLGDRSFPYPKAVRRAVLAAMNAPAISVADLARLDWRLGMLYADAVERTCTALSLKPALIGLHGQTLYHQATARPYLGKPVRATWQIGEAAVVSERLRAPVVSDFRPADLAAGGQGAPLVPMLDVCLYRSATKHRILLNLGGIANLTAIPAGSDFRAVMAFDTGPANMVIDALMSMYRGKPFDHNGRVAARGQVLTTAVNRSLGEAWFKAPPPKSCGREQFGQAYAKRFAALCADASPQDRVASATQLTVASIVDAHQRFVRPHLDAKATGAHRTELIVAGGGTRNAWLMQQLTSSFAQLGVSVKTADETGMPAQAKEAVAFALLAWLRWHGLPGNVPSATGARGAAVLGQVSLW